MISSKIGRRVWVVEGRGGTLNATLYYFFIILGDGVAVVVGGCAQIKLRKSEKKIEKWVPSMCSDRMWESGINNTASLEQPRQRKQDILNAPRWRRDVDWKRFFFVSFSFHRRSPSPCSHCALAFLSSYLIFGETFVSRILHDYIDRHF